MHCYKTFAATTLIANMFEILPEIGRKLPHVVIAEWMAQNDIEPEDVLYAESDVIKAKLVSLIKYSRPQISHAVGQKQTPSQTKGKLEQPRLKRSDYHTKDAAGEIYSGFRRRSSVVAGMNP